MPRIRRLHLSLLVCLTACSAEAILKNNRGDCTFDGDLSGGVQGDLRVYGSLPAAVQPPGTSVAVAVRLTGIGVGGLCGKEIRWTPGPGSGTVPSSSTLTSEGLGRGPELGVAETTWVLPTGLGVTATLTAEVVQSFPVLQVVFTFSTTPPAAAIALTPASLTYNATQGGANPASQLITITNSGGGTLSGLSLGSTSYGPGATGWLQAPTLSGTTANPSVSFTLQPVTVSLAAGTYAATVPVQSVGTSNSPQNVAVTLIVAAPAPACSTIEDQFATDAGWTATATTSGVSPTQSVSFEAAGGTPGGYRQMKHMLTGVGVISVYHYYGTTTYNPGTQGAIDHLNYFEDQIELNPPSVGAAVGTGFSIMQGGTRYNVILRSPSGAFTNTAWEKTSRLNLIAADFPGVNFSVTGGPITFGYFRSNSNTGGGAYTITHGIDNWKVEICRPSL